MGQNQYGLEHPTVQIESAVRRLLDDGETMESLTNSDLRSFWAETLGLTISGRNYYRAGVRKPISNYITGEVDIEDDGLQISLLSAIDDRAGITLSALNDAGKMLPFFRYTTLDAKKTENPYEFFPNITSLVGIHDPYKNDGSLLNYRLFPQHFKLALKQVLVPLSYNLWGLRGNKLRDEVKERVESAIFYNSQWV